MVVTGLRAMVLALAVEASDDDGPSWEVRGEDEGTSSS